MNDPILIARGVTKVFRGGGLEVPVLSAIDLTVMPGETIAVVGASGSGKSTLSPAGRLAESASWFCLPVPSPAARILGAGKCRHAPADSP